MNTPVEEDFIGLIYAGFASTLEGLFLEYGGGHVVFVQNTPRTTYRVPRWSAVLLGAAHSYARARGFGEAHPALVERNLRHWFPWAVQHREEVLAVWDLGWDAATVELLRTEVGETPSGAPEGVFER